MRALVTRASSYCTNYYPNPIPNPNPGTNLGDACELVLQVLDRAVLRIEHVVQLLGDLMKVRVRVRVRVEG